MKHREIQSHEDISKNLELSTSRRRGRRVGKWLFAGLAAIVLAWVGLRWGMEGNTPSIRYTTRPVVKGNLTVTVTATGNLAPTNQVDVGSELSGIVHSVEVDYNDEVRVGQVLARLDTTKLHAQVLQSRAALEVARAKVLQVQATIKESSDQFERLRTLERLSGQKAVSKIDLDAAQASLARALADEAGAKASVNQAQAVLEVNETDFSKAQILSPINGIVLKRTVEPGQTVAASLQAPVLFTLAEDLTHMQLHVDVDEADVGKVKAGQRASFTVDAYPDRVFPAKIVQVRFAARETASGTSGSSSSSGGVVTYETLLSVDNADLSLRPGMTATADIVVKEIDNAVLVSNAALRFSPPVNDKEITAPRGNVLNRLFPRPPASSGRQRSDAADGKKQQRVWVLRSGEPDPVLIRTGSSDGAMTEVLGEEIHPGMEVVVDAVSMKR